MLYKTFQITHQKTEVALSDWDGPSHPKNRKTVKLQSS